MRTNSAAAFPNGWKTRLFGSDGEVAGVAEREAVKFSGEKDEEEVESMVVVGEAEQGGAVEMRLW